MNKPRQTLFLLMLLSLTSCQESLQDSPISQGNLPLRLEISLGSDSFIPTRSSTPSTESIKTATVFLFDREELVMRKPFKDTRNSVFMLPVRLLNKELSAYVVANEELPTVLNREELQRLMSIKRITPQVLDNTGLPMSSAELVFTPSPYSGVRISARLERVHSVIAIKTPSGVNSNYDVRIKGAQMESGALFATSDSLAPAHTNTDSVDSFELSATAEEEPVGYIYPTDGEISVEVAPKNKKIPSKFIKIPSAESRTRNRKYVIKVTPSSGDGNQTTRHAPDKGSLPEHQETISLYLEVTKF